MKTRHVLTTRDRILARIGLMRVASAPVPATDRRPADLVVRQTVSRETDWRTGIMHEAKCKHCPDSAPWIVFDTLSSCLERGRKHLLDAHGIRLDRVRDVQLGHEQWD